LLGGVGPRTIQRLGDRVEMFPGVMKVQRDGAQQNGAGFAWIDGASGRAGARAVLLSKE